MLPIRIPTKLRMKMRAKNRAASNSSSPSSIPIMLSGGTKDTAMEIPGMMSAMSFRTQARVAAIPEVVATMKYSMAVRSVFGRICSMVSIPNVKVSAVEITMVRRTDFKMSSPGVLMALSSPTMIPNAITRMGVSTGVTNIPPMTMGAFPRSSPVTMMKIDRTKSV